MENVLTEIEKIGIVPVIKIDDAKKAVPLARALAKGHIPCAEITFRTKEGEEAIKRISAEVPEILLGAGTVLTEAQVDAAISAGAKFIVSPGLNPKIVEYCIKKNIPITPGCANPSDVEQAIEKGLSVVKFFPAEQAGGLDYIKAMSAPYPNLRFMPTGGINKNNLVKYLSFKKILACGGSWMVKADFINDEKFDEIEKLCKEAVLEMLGFKLIKVSINHESKIAADIFGESSLLVADKSQEDHIMYETNSLLRAKAYLDRKGTAYKDSDGVIELEESMNNFKIKITELEG